MTSFGVCGNPGRLGERRHVERPLIRLVDEGFGVELLAVATDLDTDGPAPAGRW